MSSANSIRAIHLPVYTLAFGGIGAGYAALANAAAVEEIPFPGRLVIFQNYTNTDVMVSYDGVNDHYPLRSSEVIVLDYCSDSATTVTGFYVPSQTVFYVKLLPGAVAAASGSVYASVVVGEDL